MRKEIYECDRCGQQIVERKKIILQEYNYKDGSSYKTYNTLESKDICEECFNSFVDWLEHDRLD